jgi:parallel beta-helix repeat protein
MLQSSRIGEKADGRFGPDEVKVGHSSLCLKPESLSSALDRTATPSRPNQTTKHDNMNKLFSKLPPLTTTVLSICAGVAFLTATTAVAQQGAQRMLYTVPNSTFIENPSGDSVVTVNDTSGSISTLQTSINNARSGNPSSIIVINLERGATYTVNGAGLVLGSQECLIGSGALIQAASSSVTVPLITITTGSTNVSIAGGTLDGNGANINGITGSTVARVNVDEVTVQDCGLDCILLTGKGSTTYNNELSVTRCDASGSDAHAGISIQNATQAAIVDNNCHNNSAGIYTATSAWNDIANNTCNNNTTGIDISSGDDNVVANNTCNNNATGIQAGGTAHMIAANSMGGNTTAGISSTGSNDNFVDNLFSPGNAVNFSSGGTSDNILAYKAAISASGENYFYPPLIDNQHTVTTIVNGMGRTDLTISSTTIDNVQSQYNTAMADNPNDVVVLHLNGTFTVGATPLTLQSNTCVLLNGTIEINSSTTATAAISCSDGQLISISGGTIDASNNTGITGISVLDSTMIQIDSMTLQNFGSNASSIPGSDAIHFSDFGGGSPPHIVTRCYINGSAGRAIWSESPKAKGLYSANTFNNTRAGIDCDAQTFGAVCMFNTCLTNLYGIWYEQGASHNTSIGNVCEYNTRYQLDVGNNADTVGTVYNSFLCNVAEGATAIVSGAVGTNTYTSFNFLFDNTAINGTIKSTQVGTNNYFSQNYLSGGSLSTAGAETFFNSPDVDGNLQILDSNSGLGVIVQGAATTNSAPIVTAQPADLGNGTGDDEWQFIPTDGGFCKVINKNSGLAMVVQGAATNNGALIVQYAYSSGSSYNDEWLIQSAGNGLYNFFNRGSGLNLDVTGASTNVGTQLDQWAFNGGANQQFALVEDAPPLVVPDFTLAATPASQTVTVGNGTTYTATVSALNGFSGSVALTVSGLPTGAGGNFNPTSINGSGSSTLTITTAANTPVGTNTLTIQGTSGSLVHTTNVTLIVNASGGSLPSGWTDADIGAVGIAGSAGYNSGTFTVSGSGSDIWTTGDQFNFAYESVTNDTTIIARVVSETGTASYAKAALMIRETTATNSVEASVLLTPTNGVAMEVRPTTGAATINVVGWVAGPVPPQWLKLVRSGSNFTASYSVNGSNWTQLASTNVTMASTAKAGLAVTSHDNTSLNTATFDNVSINAASIDTTAIYQLENEASSLVLNNQGFLTNGSAITQWTITTSSNLNWKFIPTTNGYYQINSEKSGLDAVVMGAYTTNGAGIIQWSFGSAGNDQWKPQQNGDGSYTFFNLHSGLVLEDPGSSTNKTTQMDQWGSNGGSNQKWVLLKQ